MTLKFVPPKEEAGKLPRYGSYVVSNGLKVHGRLGDAKNSWRNRGWHYVETGELVERYGKMRPERAYVTLHAFILENVEGEWFTLYEIAPGLKEEELPWMKEYMSGPYGHTVLYTDYAKNSEYYQQKIADGTYRVFKKATPMTTDEYVTWRVAVEHERLRSLGIEIPLERRGLS